MNQLDNYEILYPETEFAEVPNEDNSNKFSTTYVEGKFDFAKRKSRIKDVREKMILASLMKNEEIIWNKQNSSRYKLRELASAWHRIANRMPSGFTVAKCKVMWKSLKDSKRYRTKPKNKEKTDEDFTDTKDEDDDWEFKDVLSFLTPTDTKHQNKTCINDSGSCSTDNVNESFSGSKSNYSCTSNKLKINNAPNTRKRTRYNGDEEYAAQKDDDGNWELHDVLPFANPGSINIHKYSPNSSFSGTLDELGESFSENKSNYSNVNIDEALEKSTKDKIKISGLFQNMTNIVDKLVDVTSAQTTTSTSTSVLKHHYIWGLIESLYDRMDEHDVDDLNHSFINMAYTKLQGLRK